MTFLFFSIYLGIMRIFSHQPTSHTDLPDLFTPSSVASAKFHQPRIQPTSYMLANTAVSGSVLSSTFPKSNHRRFVHFLTRCGVFPVRPERSAAKSKATGPARSLLFDFAAGTATLRANGWCFLKEFHTVPMSCGLI